MKNHISLIFTLAMLVAVSFGCKVGAEDPGLTFASRDGRLIATWKITNVEGLTTNSVSQFGTTTTTMSYNGTILTTTTTSGSNSITNTQSYTLEMIIDKDGKLTVTETLDGDVTVENTYWEWVNADKNKSMLTLGGESVIQGTWTVLRLAGAELILHRWVKQVETNNGNTTSNEVTLKLTFEAE